MTGMEAYLSLEGKTITVRLQGPSKSQLAALQEFADKKGRYWKAALVKLWLSSKNYDPLLVQVRNYLGPKWLYDVCRIKPRRT